jgi:hypothetical protein
MAMIVLSSHATLAGAEEKKTGPSRFNEDFFQRDGQWSTPWTPQNGRFQISSAAKKFRIQLSFVLVGESCCDRRRSHFGFWWRGNYPLKIQKSAGLMHGLIILPSRREFQRVKSSLSTGISCTNIKNSFMQPRKVSCFQMRFHKFMQIEA